MLDRREHSQNCIWSFAFFFHIKITEKLADLSRRSRTRREKGRARVLFSEIRHARVAVSRPPRFLPAAPLLAKKKKIKIK